MSHTKDAGPRESGGFLRDHLVTFAVHRWFRGPGGDHTTVSMWPPFVRARISEFGIDYDLGTRMLVSGRLGRPTRDGQTGRPTASTCGFTGPYDAAVAVAWARAFNAE